VKALIGGLSIGDCLGLTLCPLSAMSWRFPMRRVGEERVEFSKEVGGSMAAPHLFEFPPLPRRVRSRLSSGSFGGGVGVGARDHRRSGCAGAGSHADGSPTFWFTLPLQGGLP